MLIQNAYLEIVSVHISSYFEIGQLEQLNFQHSGRIELLIDNIHHYFIKVSETSLQHSLSQLKAAVLST